MLQLHILKHYYILYNIHPILLASPRLSNCKPSLAAATANKRQHSHHPPHTKSRGVTRPRMHSVQTQQARLHLRKVSFCFLGSVICGHYFLRPAALLPSAHCDAERFSTQLIIFCFARSVMRLIADKRARKCVLQPTRKFS